MEDKRKTFVDLVFKGMTTAWVTPTGLVTVKTLYEAYANKVDVENFKYDEAIELIMDEMKWNDFQKSLAIPDKQNVI